MRITPENTFALIVDLQERMMPAIHEQERVVARTALLIEGLKALHIPMLVPRQYPKGLGDTVAPIREAVGEHSPMDKISFSVCRDENAMARIQALGRKHVIVCGVEAHICVLQSVIDLCAKGFQPFLVCDCLGSRSPIDREFAIQRAKQEGALLTTAEAILFELLGEAGSDTFRAISKLVK